jgi:filamentous hemagglutinin
VSGGTITVRDTANQEQDVADLSRDTAQANGSISPIFDKEKEQRRLQEVQLIVEIGSRAADIARTQGEINGLNAARAKLAEKGTYEPGPDASREEKAEYQKALRETSEYRTAMEKYGTGSTIQRGIQAAMAALSGLAGGDVAGALAGAAAPELAHMLKSTEDNPAVNTIAHAILGGAVAAIQGNSAAAGAAGAATGELAAKAIAGMLYPDVTGLSKLSEEQKQTVSALATISAGMAGGLAGDSTGAVVAGGQAGKNAAENNALSVAENKSRAQEMIHCQGSAACEKDVIDKYKKINAEQHESVVGCKGAQECVNKANEVGQLQADYANRTNELLEKARANGGLSPAEQNELSILQVTTIQLEADRNAAIHNALMSGESPKAKQLAINSLAQVAGTSAAGIAAGIGKSGGKGSPVPVPEPVKATNGLSYQSNPKHTQGTKDFGGSKAGIEPKNSLDLFGSSVSISGGKKRFTMDSDGNVHQFMSDGAGNYHWAGSTADKRNPLILDNRVKSELRKQEGWKIK